jgi:hypothetical protein
MEAKPNGWIPRVWPFRSTRSTAGAVQEQSVAEDDENPPRIGDIVVPEPIEQDEAMNALGLSAPSNDEDAQIISPTPKLKTLPLVTNASKASTKRKRAIERPDAYEDFGTGQDAEDDKEERSEKRAKLSRKTKSKAKSPIVAARKSNGERLPKPTQPETQKPKRGRPPKAKQSANTGDLQLSSTEANIPPDSANTVPGDIEGVSSILENPSPIKVMRPSRRQEPPRNTQSLESDDGLPDLPDIDQQARSETPTVDIRASAGTPIDIKIIDPDLLESMLEKAKLVGYKLTRETKELKLVKKPPHLHSKPAKKIEKLLDALNLSYVKLRDSKAAKDLSAIRSAHVAITDSIHSLKDETGSILTDRLGNPALGIDYFKAVPTRSLLMDLYFNILPKILECLVLGAEAYNDNGTLQRSFLEEFASLTEIYYALAKTAIDQPKDSQPRADQIPPTGGSLEFRIQQPTKGIIPQMRELRANIKAELRARARAKKTSEPPEITAERERVRRQQEDAEELQRRRNIKDIRRRQREDLARQRARPVWGQLMKDEDARAEAKEVGIWAREQIEKARARKARLNQNQEVEEDVDADPFADDPFEEQRVSIFGKNNNQQNHPRAWTNTEKAAFVDFLRVYNGTLHSWFSLNPLLMLHRTRQV